MRYRSLLQSPTVVLAIVVTAAVTASDWPIQVLQGFWSSHSVLTTMVTAGVLLLLTGAVVQGIVDVRATLERRRTYQALAVMGFAGPADATDRATSLAILMVDGQDFPADRSTYGLFVASERVPVIVGRAAMSARFLELTATPEGRDRWIAVAQSAIDGLDQCMATWLPALLLGPRLDARFVSLLERVASVRGLFLSALEAVRYPDEADRGVLLSSLMLESRMLAADLRKAQRLALEGASVEEARREDAKTLRDTVIAAEPDLFRETWRQRLREAVVRLFE